MKKTMELKAEIATIFCDLNDTEIEQIVGGATFGDNAIAIAASSHIEVTGGSFALATTSAQTQIVTLPDGHTLGFAYSNGFGFVYK